MTESLKDKTDIMNARIIRDMSEGIVTVGINGEIMSVNNAAVNILGLSEEQMLGRSWVSCFFGYEGNDKFNQLMLDSIYDSDTNHTSVVPYYSEQGRKILSVNTSCLKKSGEDAEKIGIIAVINDVTLFSRYLSPEVVKQFYDKADGASLGGSRKTLTVMMSDIRGFTAMCERTEPAGLIEMLNHYLKAMTEVIDKYGGTIIEFIGDGIMALFGAPNYYEDHADRAIAAAVDMQIRMEEVNSWNAAHGYETLKMGIGINSGEMIVGNIGSEIRSKYGVLGSPVNTAGRIESYTVGGQILVSENTMRFSGEDPVVRTQTEVFPKGMSEPLMLYDITGIGGKYQLSFKSESEEMTELETAVEVEFARLEGKHVSDECHKARIIRINRHGCVIVTDAELKIFDNIKLLSEGAVYGKVLSGENNTWELEFTATNDKFDNRLGRIV